MATREPCLYKPPNFIRALHPALMAHGPWQSGLHCCQEAAINNKTGNTNRQNNNKQTNNLSKVPRYSLYCTLSTPPPRSCPLPAGMQA